MQGLQSHLVRSERAHAQHGPKYLLLPNGVTTRRVYKDSGLHVITWPVNKRTPTKHCYAAALGRIEHAADLVVL